jgi:hypothetical protein
VHVNDAVTGDRYQPSLNSGCLLHTLAVITGFAVAVDADDGR